MAKKGGENSTPLGIAAVPSAICTQKQFKIYLKIFWKKRKYTTPLGIEPRISGSVDQRLIHWATESLMLWGRLNLFLKKLTLHHVF